MYFSDAYGLVLMHKIFCLISLALNFFFWKFFYTRTSELLFSKSTDLYAFKAVLMVLNYLILTSGHIVYIMEPCSFATDETHFLRVCE